MGSVCGRKHHVNVAAAAACTDLCVASSMLHWLRVTCLAHYCGWIIEGGLLAHAMEAHYCDCIIEGGLLTHAMEAHYCDCIIEGGLLTQAMEAHYCV